MVSAIATSASTLGISLPSAIVFTSLVAAGGLATRGVWKAMPADKVHDSRLWYVPAAFFVASLPATVSIGSFDLGIWCDLLGADVQFQPVHFLLLLIGALSAASGFVWGGPDVLGWDRT
jgi:hypothetical protein